MLLKCTKHSEGEGWELEGFIIFFADFDFVSLSHWKKERANLHNVFYVNIVYTIRGIFQTIFFTLNRCCVLSSANKY